MKSCRICRYLPNKPDTCFHNTESEEVTKLFEDTLDKVPEMRERIILESEKQREYIKTYRKVKKIIRKELRE